MGMNRSQFQEGMSLFEFFQHWGEETQCEAAVEQARWPDGFRLSALRRDGPLRAAGEGAQDLSVQPLSSSDLGDCRDPV
jgi:hypothetical protein